MFVCIGTRRLTMIVASFRSGGGSRLAHACPITEYVVDTHVEKAWVAIASQAMLVEDKIPS